jgi:homoserine dehydrogenase
MMPTASSVVGDIIEVARSTRHSENDRRPSPLGWESLKSVQVEPMERTRAAYYVRFTVFDRPGVLSAISGIFGSRGISLAQVIQKSQNPQTGWVSLVVLTHEAMEADLQAALKETRALDVVKDARLIRLEEF